MDAAGNPLAYAGGIGSTTTQSVKAKVAVTVPAFNVFGYIDLCLATPGQFAFNSCCPDGPQAPGCTKFYPDTSVDDTTVPFWISNKGRLWATSPATAPSRFGYFPSVQVKALAFGSIPVTATIDIAQVRGRDGLFRPLDFNWVLGSPFQPGDVVGGHVAPPKNSANSYSYYSPARFTGQVTVSVRDVKVDGVPLAVGSQCRTATPARLALGAPGGFADSGLTAVDVRGRPGEFALTPGSTMQGTLDIPAFRGCRDGGRSLDPLLTSLVSAPGNPVEATVSRTFDDCGAACPPYPTTSDGTGSTQRGTDPAVSAQRRIKALRGAPASAAMQVARALRTHPRALRASLLDALPPGLAAAVRAIR